MLRAHNVTKRFGSHVAVDRLDLAVRPRTLHAIIGPNGAGKTTLFDLLSGETRPTVGTITFDDRDVTHLDVAARSRLGLGRSFQRTNIFPKLSVLENVRLGAQSRTTRSFEVWQSATSLSDVMAHARDILRDADLMQYASQPAIELAGGDQRLLELAITIATEPTILLLDEPSQGLSPPDARRLTERIRGLATRYTIVLVEHNMPLVMGLADEITVMNLGRVLANGRPEAIRADPKVRAAYLGTRP